MTEMISRRAFVRRSGIVTGVGALVPTILAGCGSSGESTTTATPQTSAPGADMAELREELERQIGALREEFTDEIRAPRENLKEATTTTATPQATAAVEETTTTAMMEEAPNQFESIVLAQVAGWNSLDNNRTTAAALATGQHTFEGLLIKLPDRSLIPGLATEMPQQLDGWAESASFATPGVPSKLNELLDQALEEPDFAKQNELYAQANEILVTEAGAVPILFQPIAHAWHKSVAGYQMPQTLGMTLFGVHPRG